MQPIILQNSCINREPYLHYVQHNVLDETFAKEIQAEILGLPDDAWDRYDNPFEQKYTLRDKFNFPPKCMELFNYLESEEFMKILGQIVEIHLLKDDSRNFWGIHKYKDGDYLDIHVDAGIHPSTRLKKQITLGFYFSKDWTEENGGHLEIWRGTNASQNDAKLIECCSKVLPVFNTMIFFECDDYSWHGNPTPVHISGDERRIFLTISYLSENFKDLNKRQKAFFVPLPDEPPSEEKTRLRMLRADPEKYKEIYRTTLSSETK